MYNDFTRTASNISGTTSQRNRSPSMGRQTAKQHAKTVSWMRRTLMPVDAPSRIPEVFLNAERSQQNGTGTALNRSGRNISPRAGMYSSQHHRTSSRSPTPSSRRDNRNVVVPTLVSEALYGGGERRRSQSPFGAATNNSWTTTRYEREHTTTGISPHRHAHSHCVPLRASQLTKTIQNSGAQTQQQLGLSTATSMAATFNNRPLTMRSTSSSRANAPRWGDPLQHATLRAHSSSRGLSLSAADAEVDLHSRQSVSAVRALQRSANSSLPVCNTVGVDNSNCTCYGHGTAGDTSSGELMVHAIDTLLRANRNDGATSPARQKLIRSNSSPVANRVENIVKKEVEKRIHLERERFEEEQRKIEEMRKAKERENEARHKFEVSKAERERELAQQALINEKSARARAEAEEIAAKEKLARTQAEDEAGKLRDELSKIDSKIVSPGKIRVQEGMSRDGGNAEKISEVLNNNSTSAASITNERGGSGGKFIGGAAAANNNSKPLLAADEEDEDDSFAAFSSVRKDAETKHKTGSGHYDPVSSKALQRQNVLQQNVEGERQEILNNTNEKQATSLLLPATPNARSNNNQQQPQQGSSYSGIRNNLPQSPLSQGIDSVVSQLASAGSSPFRGRNNNNNENGNDEDVYEDEEGNLINLRAPQVGQSVVRGSRRGQQQQNQNHVHFHQENDDGDTPRKRTKIVRAPKLVDGELVYEDGRQHQEEAAPPRIGMKERDEHIMELMRKTHERHNNVLASQKARYEATRSHRENNSNNTSNVSNNTNGGTYRSSHFNDQSIGFSSPGSTNSTSTPVRPSTRPDATLLDTSMSPIPGGDHNNNNNQNNLSGTTNEQHRLLVAASNYDRDDYYNSAVAVPRRSQERSVSRQNNNATDDGTSLSPFRAATGPHYSPESLIERPMQAGPSGLWVNRVVRK